MIEETFSNYGFTVPRFTPNPSSQDPKSIFYYFMAQSLLYLGNNIWRSHSAEEDTANIISVRKQEDEIEVREKIKFSEDEANLMIEQHRRILREQCNQNTQLYRDHCIQEEFTEFCKTNWTPQFNIGLDVILNKYEQISKDEFPKMNIMLAHTESMNCIFHSIDKHKDYLNLCDDILDSSSAQKMFNISYFAAWNNQSKGIVPDSMILHYVMQGLPTVVIFPQITESHISIDCVLWSIFRGNDKILFKYNVTNSPINNDSNRISLLRNLIELTSVIVSESYSEFLWLKKNDHSTDIKNAIKDPIILAQFRQWEDVKKICMKYFPEHLIKD